MGVLKSQQKLSDMEFYKLATEVVINCCGIIERLVTENFVDVWHQIDRNNYEKQEYELLGPVSLRVVQEKMASNALDMMTSITSANSIYPSTTDKALAEEDIAVKHSLQMKAITSAECLKTLLEVTNRLNPNKIGLMENTIDKLKKLTKLLRGWKNKTKLNKKFLKGKADDAERPVNDLDAFNSANVGTNFCNVNNNGNSNTNNASNSNAVVPDMASFTPTVTRRERHSIRKIVAAAIQNAEKVQ